jgi:hypothetical protein
LIRQFRFAGFDKWGVQSIIGLLPTILHLSLFLFMVGLVVFLYALDHIIAQVVASVAGFLFLVYVTTNVLPILAIGCPYRTPLTALLHSFVYGPGRTIAIIPRRLYYILVRASQRKRYRATSDPNTSPYDRSSVDTSIARINSGSILHCPGSRPPRQIHRQK